MGGKGRPNPLPTEPAGILITYLFIYVCTYCEQCNTVSKNMLLPMFLIFCLTPWLLIVSVTRAVHNRPKSLTNVLISEPVLCTLRQMAALPLLLCPFQGILFLCQIKFLLRSVLLSQETAFDICTCRNRQHDLIAEVFFS